MKKIILSLAVFSAMAFVSALNPELEIGKPVPSTSYQMQDISGKQVTLMDAKDEKGLLVIFSCNTCPYVKLSESRIIECAALAKKNKIGVILVNSNEAQRNEEDSFEAMQKYAVSQGYNFYYALDKNSELANAFGATRTPHCFLFNRNGLAYRGAIDDNIKDANEAKEHFLKDAITAVGEGKAVKTNSTKSIGCSIKRLEN